MSVSLRFAGPGIAILALAGVALIFGSGCNFDLWANAVGYDPDSVPEWVIIRCNPDTKTLEVTESVDYPFGSGGFSEIRVGSPLNGKACSVSTENQGRAFTISEAVIRGIIAPPEAQPKRESAHAVAPKTSLTDTFAHLMPLLFAPTFPTSDYSKIPANCPSTLGAYLVNHVEGTVTSFGICPLRVLKEIQVRDEPLQLAVTPDGSTVLVTSYDSAVTFIDTKTDAVTATLNLPNYNPSGIAISPDGSRAYVTHYLDIQPALLVIDVPNRKLLSTIPLPAAYPRTVVLTPDGTQAWVTYYGSNLLTIVDLFSGTVSSSINFPAQLGMGMAFNPTGTKAFVAGIPNNLLVVDTATLQILANIVVGEQPTDVVVDGGYVIVNSGFQKGLWIIDVKTNKLVSKPASVVSGGSMGLLIHH
jgi:YVTN family beta-propeller protein